MLLESLWSLVLQDRYYHGWERILEKAQLFKYKHQSWSFGLCTFFVLSRFSFYTSNMGTTVIDRLTMRSNEMIYPDHSTIYLANKILKTQICFTWCGEKPMQRHVESEVHAAPPLVLPFSDCICPRCSKSNFKIYVWEPTGVHFKGLDEGFSSLAAP